MVEEYPLADRGVPGPLRRLLTTDYRLGRTLVVHESAAPGLVYDMDDACFVPLTGFDTVSRPGLNLLMNVRTAPR